MSNSIKGYLQAILFLFVSHCLCAFLLAIPMYYYVLSQATYETIALIVSCLLWGIAGYLLGRTIYQKAFLKACPIMISYLVIVIIVSLLNQEFTITSLGQQVLRMVVFFGSTRLFMKIK